MADIAKVTTPITNKNIISNVKEHRSADSAALDFQDLGKVLKSAPDSALLQQNTGNIDQQKPPALMMDLLTDPQVAVGYIRSIMLLQEIVALIPQQNQAFTEEIEQLFSQLQLAPEELAEEMVQQENASTAFKGELFDFLRNVLQEQPSPDTQKAVLQFLKAVNLETSREDILHAVSGSFSYLSEAFAPSKALSAQLADVAAQFAKGVPPKQTQPDGTETGGFAQLQRAAGKVLGDVERSILVTDRTSRLISMVRYNLSRYNDNTELLGSASNVLMGLLEEGDKPKLLQMLYQHLTQHQLTQADRLPEEAAPLSGSKVMNVLTEILEKQTGNPALRQMKADSMEGIVHSLLSSPSNFTPLLHFILPVQDENTNAMAEMWINPDEDTVDARGNPDSAVHLLLVFEIDRMGRFETELYVKDKEIRMSMFCPPAMTEMIGGMASTFRDCARASDYRMKEISIQTLARTRSLVDVFPALPQKRTGIHVRI